MISGSRSRGVRRCASSWSPDGGRCTTLWLVDRRRRCRRSSTRSPRSPQGAGVRIRRVPADQIERQARTERAPGRRRVRGAGADRATSTSCSPTRAPSSSRSTASPTRRTSARCCGAPRPRARPGWCSPRHRAVGLTPAVAKAAAGAIEYLPDRVRVRHPGALDRASRAGVWCVGLDADGEQSLFELTVADAPLVLVLGAEGRGLSRLARGALRRRRVDPDARSHRVAERRARPPRSRVPRSRRRRAG